MTAKPIIAANDDPAAPALSAALAGFVDLLAEACAAGRMPPPRAANDNRPKEDIA